MIIKGPFAAVLLVLLFVSVAANLTIAGFALGRSAGPERGGDIERIVALGVQAFPPPIRDKIDQRTRDERAHLRAKLEVVQRARRQMFSSMRADPFDKAALDRAYEALRMATDDLQRSGQKIVAEVLAETSPQERHKIRHRRRPPPRR